MRKILLGSVCLAALGFAAPLSAQTAAPPQASSGIETVTVTAEKRAENLQDVPLDVNAVSPEQLQNSGVRNLQDLSILVPGVSVEISAANSEPYIRGVGSSSFGPGVESPNAIYVDGVYYASEYGIPTDFISVAQVEVLKGPQGTLFGRNATGGLIQITTRTPNQETHLDTDVGYGNYNTVTADFYGSTGILDDLAADVAVKVSHQGDGYGTNLFNGTAVQKTDLDLNARSKWVFTPSDSTTLTVIFDFEQERSNDNSQRVLPGTHVAPFIGPIYGGSVWDTDNNANPYLFHNGGGVSGKLEQDLGFARLTDTVAYRQSNTAGGLDLDDTATNFEGAVLDESENEFTEELQLQSEADSRIKWTVGVYDFHDVAADTPADIVVSPLADTILGGPFLADHVSALQTTGSESADSLAGYGQATMEIFPATDLTLGARYNTETRKLHDVSSTDIGTVNLHPLTNYNAKSSFDAFTYRAVLDHHFTPDIMAYVSADTGFKSGGYNVAAPLDPAYAPEKLTAYAAGLKNNFFDDRLRLNMEAFYYDYRNLQIAVVESGAPGITNGGTAHDYGLDLDAEGQITDSFRLTVGLELLHSRIADSLSNIAIGSASGTLPTHLGAVTGNTPPLSPHAVVSLAGDYTFAALSGQVDLNASYQYNSGYYLQLDNVIKQSSFSMLNLSARWNSDDGHYSAQIWGKNMTDEAVIQTNVTLPFGPQDAGYFPPRTFGFTLGYHY